MKKFPQVLLLGNGINIAYGGSSWSELLKEITTNEALLGKELKRPMPLRAILLTGNYIKTALKNAKPHLMGKIDNARQGDYYKKLLTMGLIIFSPQTTAMS